MVRTEHLTFSNSAFCPHSVFMCFVWIWEQTSIISLYNINWLVCITETECVYCAVRTEQSRFINSTFRPHSVFTCFVWISEQTVTISLYKFIGFYNRGKECLLRGTDWVFIWDRYSFVLKGLNFSERSVKFFHILPTVGQSSFSWRILQGSNNSISAVFFKINACMTTERGEKCFAYIFRTIHDTTAPVPACLKASECTADRLT